MHGNRVCLSATVLLLACSLLAVAQQSADVIVPPLVNFSGMLRDGNGKALTGIVGVTFYLYKDQQAGAPLWIETQNVQPDKSGHYSVMLGSTTSQGLPPSLFASGEARWLGVQAQGQEEQPRVMLLSVPYALKAADAETIGGLPPSAFALAPQPTSTSNSGATLQNNVSSASISGSGTTDFLPLWTNGTSLGNSVLFQLGSGSTANVGVNTTTPAATLDVKGSAVVRGNLQLPSTGTATKAAGFNSDPFNLLASSFNSSSGKAVNQNFQWRAEPTGNNTSSPSGTLNLLFGSGSSNPTETGLKVSSKGLFTFAAGQTFPGTGTVTSVGSGGGLTGGPITKAGTLSIAIGGVTNAMLQDSTMTLNAGTDLTGGGVLPLGGSTTISLDTSRVPQLNANNTFVGAQAINGTLSVLGGGNFQPFLVQSASNFGTWLELSNISTGGHTWNILSAGSANSEGAGNLGITDLTGQSTIFLEGNIKAASVTATSNSRSNYGGSFTGFIPPSGSGNAGTSGLNAVGGSGDPISFSSGGNGVDAAGGTAGCGSGCGFGGYGILAFGGGGGNGPNPGLGGDFLGGNSSCDGDNCGGDGVFGSPGSGPNFPDGYAGNFFGDINVTGAIFAHTKDFKIDHPLDPGNKYLLHASIESSEMMNLYSGNVTTDAEGEATVQLPEWFEALNTDFRYQLTVIGQFAQAIIAQKITNHQFMIRTSVPNIEVSWQVTGLRHDAFAKKYPLVVEQEKEPRLRGFYIRPELYGAPPEKQIEWARHPELMKRIKDHRDGNPAVRPLAQLHDVQASK